VPSLGTVIVPFFKKELGNSAGNTAFAKLPFRGDLKDKKEDIKAIFKTNYAPGDKTCDVYIKYFCKNINHEVLLNLMSDTEYDIFEADSVQDFNILNGLSIRKLCQHRLQKVYLRESDKNTLLYYGKY